VGFHLPLGTLASFYHPEVDLCHPEVGFLPLGSGLSSLDHLKVNFTFRGAFLHLQNKSSNRKMYMKSCHLQFPITDPLSSVSPSSDITLLLRGCQAHVFRYLSHWHLASAGGPNMPHPTKDNIKDTLTQVMLPSDQCMQGRPLYYPLTLQSWDISHTCCSTEHTMCDNAPLTTLPTPTTKKKKNRGIRN